MAPEGSSTSDVRGQKLTILATLTQVIENEYTAIPLDTLVNVAKALSGRTSKCLGAKGHHCEHLL